VSADSGTKRCASETAGTDATFYACPANGRPCVMLEPLRAQMIEDLGYIEAAQLTADAVKYGLPCGSCYIGARDARSLAGLRLGKHERRILLAAPPGSKVGYRASRHEEMVQPKIMYPDGPSRAAEEANRRALKKLEAVGLIELSRDYTWDKDQEPPKWFKAKQARSRYRLTGRRYRSAMLTPLGELVAQRCRDELEGGKPIRWAKLVDALAEEVRQPLSELFRQFALWTGGVIYFSDLGAALARTREGSERASARREAAQRFQAFVASLAQED
jgi:hypothetical protein